MLIHIRENKRFYKNDFSDQSPYSLTVSWYDFNLGIHRALAKRALNTNTLSKDIDASIRFALHEAHGLFIDWIKNDCQEPIEELVHHTDLYFSLIYNQVVGNVSISKYFEECADEPQKS